MQQNVLRQLPAALLLSGLVSSPLMAAGFSIRAQSAQSLGTGYAAEGTGNSPSLIFSNPALIGSFDQHEFSLGAAQIMPDIDFKNGKRTYPSLGTDANDPNNSVDDITGGASTVPTLAGVHPINEKINVGWNVTVPFATKSDYGEEWVGRYHGVETQLQVLNFDLAASYKIDDQWTVGLGVQVQQGSGLISGASNGGAAVAGSAAEEFQAALQALGNGDSTNYNNLSGLAAAIKQSFEAQNPDFNDQSSVNTAAQTAIGTIVAQQDGAADVIAEYEGNNIAYGMVFGLTYDPMPELRLGLSYRSSVTHETEGDIVLRGDNATADAVIQGLGLTPGVDSGASLQITLPDSVILGASYMVLPELTLYGNLTYTRWSTVDNLNVKYDTADRNILVKLDFQNTLAISLGGEYSLNENLALRFGLASDPSPTTDDLRSPRSPDNDRTIISLGAGYGQDNWQIDAALAHYMFKEPKLTLKENAYPEADGRGNLEGEYSAAVNTFMLQFGYQI